MLDSIEPFVRISYSDAFDILKNSNKNKKKKFEFIIEDWGVDFQSEHERYLVEKHFQSPVIIYDYPSKIKAFYMRLNDDKKTVSLKIREEGKDEVEKELKVADLKKMKELKFVVDYISKNMEKFRKTLSKIN